MTKKQKERKARLMLNGIPRWVRVYDNPEFIDRYTVVFTGLYNNIGKDRRGTRPRPHFYVSMSENPFHPQGFGQHSETTDTMLDATPGKWGGPSIGRRHPWLGLRIAFEDLPEPCQKLVINDYEHLWNLN